MNRDTVILFTWSKCTKCREVKQKAYRYIQSGKIREYDLDLAQSYPNIMNIFKSVSPGGKVPALAVINAGRIKRGVVGADEISRLL